MNFQQLRSVREALRQGYNLTVVADVLHTSQPGVSRQIRELEQELGIDLFVRSGKRLTGLTEPGKSVAPIVERLLVEADNIRRAGQDFAQTGIGTLTIATTHTQARYALPLVVRDFRLTHPEVALHLHQGSPRQIAKQLLEGEADIGIATEALTEYPDLVALPCYRWTHVVVVPQQHPLALEDREGRKLTLQRLARFPLVTYEPGYTGRRHIDEAFRQEQLDIDIVLSAMDADVIKTYVELGLGVGIIASMAHEAARDTTLHAIDVGHLFALNLTRLAVRRGAYLRDFGYEFIRTFAPTLTREIVDAALRTEPGSNIEL